MRFLPSCHRPFTTTTLAILPTKRLALPVQVIHQDTRNHVHQAHRHLAPPQHHRRPPQHLLHLPLLKPPTRHHIPPNLRRQRLRHTLLHPTHLDIPQKQVPPLHIDVNVLPDRRRKVIKRRPVGRRRGHEIGQIKPRASRRRRRRRRRRPRSGGEARDT